ncbi:hypothetical protein [Leptospira santarosai]|uniref:hypothetical protein n=1 Tax=Leptospira santarosai TaxID=28183 RepID=UPI0024AFA69F|nr:hypothetical protein [Leptospira santarosai]MDI7189100.1 hypothetical protein [Leptospira santarosai]MDI7221234.1 hypothetical protein [Leptospira santarosai]
MSETTKNARIQKITEGEEVTFEIFIPRTDEPDILIYLDKESFLSFSKGLAEYGFLNKEEGINV